MKCPLHNIASPRARPTPEIDDPFSGLDIRSLFSAKFCTWLRVLTLPHENKDIYSCLILPPTFAVCQSQDPDATALEASALHDGFFPPIEINQFHYEYPIAFTPDIEAHLRHVIQLNDNLGFFPASHRSSVQ